MGLNIARWQQSRPFKFGAGIGAQVLTLAGGAWALTPLVLQGSPVWIDGVVIGAFVALTAYGAKRLHAVTKQPIPIPSLSERAEGAAAGRRMGMAFGAICAFEAALIAGSSIWLGHTHRATLIPLAVAAIVGGHFVPLGKIFHIPTYAYCGILMVGAVLASLLIADEDARLMTLGAVNALILWGSAGAVLCLHTGRQSVARERA